MQLAWTLIVTAALGKCLCTVSIGRPLMSLLLICMVFLVNIGGSMLGRVTVVCRCRYSMLLLVTLSCFGVRLAAAVRKGSCRLLILSGLNTECSACAVWCFVASVISGRARLLSG